jgi:3-deoxy-D-manno-octulosonic-acid transferase
MHGASVGEVHGLLPLVAEVRRREPGADILLTSTSPTGLDRAGNAVSVKKLLPIDVPWCVRRALRSARIERFVLAETELWPVLLRELMVNGIPCHIVNGRISDYTLRRYQTLRGLFAPLLSRVSSVCVASQSQAERYVDLGVPRDAVHVTGHTKYDIAPKVTSDVEGTDLRRVFFPSTSDETKIVVLGSLRPGEEGGWLEALQAIRSVGGDVKMILAPRHMEKVDYFVSKVRSTNLSWARWSDQVRGQSPDILVLDVMGKLEEAYSIAHLAFVGGTLVDIGGHNPLEPAIYGVPVVVGPYTSVIQDVLSDMREPEGVIEVRVGQNILPLLERVVAGDVALQETGQRGRQAWLQHRGAAQRVVSVIEHA